MTPPRLVWPELQWCSIRAEADSDTTELVIYDRIGEGFFVEGVTAKDVVAQLKAVTTPKIAVRINSPGGSVFDGLGIYNALRDHPATVTAHIDGVAASIASVIACAADEIVMADTGLWMIHNPQTYADGDAAEMRRTANILDKIREAMMAAYEGRTTLTRAELTAALDAETWYTAPEAIAAGFADRINAGLPAAAEARTNWTQYTAPYYRHRPPTAERTTTVPTPATGQIPGQTSIDVPASPAPGDGPDAAAALGNRLDAMQTVLDDVTGRLQRIGAAGSRADSPLARFASFGEYVLAAYRDPSIVAELATQLTGPNTGVMTDTWLREIRGIVDRGRPFIGGIGGPGPLPNTGLTINWPAYEGDLSTLVAVQSAELAELNSARIDIVDKSATIKTYGAGSRVSLQLKERSDPSYVDALMRIYALAWSARTNAAALAAAEAGGTGTVTYAGTDASLFFAAVIAANMAVHDATGIGADVVAVQRSEYLKIASALGTDKRPLYARTNPVNAPGTVTGERAQGFDVDGIPVIPVPDAAITSKAIALNRAAFVWREDGPKTIDQLMAGQLGQDYAIYGYGVGTVEMPAGIVKLGAAAA